MSDVPIYVAGGGGYPGTYPIVNADIAAAAGIAKTKLAALGITDADVAAGAAIAQSKLVLSIADANVAAGAGIAKSKLAALAIADADVAAGAGIAKSKLAALAIANADVAAAAGIVYSKLSLAGSILDADIAAGAGIAKSKLAALAIANADVAAGAAIAYSKLALTGTIVNADLAAGAAIAASKIAGYPTDATKVLLGDGTWAAPPAPTLASMGIARGATGNVAATGGTVVVNHGLSGTPTSVVIAPNTFYAASNGYYVNTFTATQFTITNNTGSIVAFFWIAIL